MKYIIYVSKYNIAYNYNTYNFIQEFTRIKCNASGIRLAILYIFNYLIQLASYFCT